VVDGGGNEDAEQDSPGPPPISEGHRQRHQLGFVAHLRQRDHEERTQERDDHERAAGRSGSGVFEPLLTRHACGGIGNREKAFPGNGGLTLGADSVFAIRHPDQRDV